MPLKDRFRRALTTRPRSNSSSTTSDPAPTPPLSATNGTTTPTPSISLSKTSTRLSKTLTWNTGRKEKKEEKARKKLEDWERRDEEEWRTPGVKYPGRKSKAHQDVLRAFEWKMRDGRPSVDSQGGGAKRRWSGWSSVSGISPGTSRMNSVDGEGGRPRRSMGAGRKWSGGGLSREVSRTEDSGLPVQTVAEE